MYKKKGISSHTEHEPFKLKIILKKSYLSNPKKVKEESRLQVKIIKKLVDFVSQKVKAMKDVRIACTFTIILLNQYLDNLITAEIYKTKITIQIKN